MDNCYGLYFVEATVFLPDKEESFKIDFVSSPRKFQKTLSQLAKGRFGCEVLGVEVDKLKMEVWSSRNG